MKSFEELYQIMVSEYIAVNEDTNPVFANSNDYENEDLIFLFSQYGWFSKKITSFFLEGLHVLQYNRWDNVSAELMHNVLEELGEDGVLSNDFRKRTHFVIFRNGFIKSIKRDFHLSPQSEYTIEFINKIFSLMNSWSPAVVAGTAYALETTALKELQAVYSILNKWYDRIDVVVPKELKYYFESHIGEIEIGHEARLREACLIDINSDYDMHEFEKGFRLALNALSDWWIGLDFEIKMRKKPLN